jgi:cytidine deaminase
MIKLTDKERQALIDLANEARRRAYAPYSNYQVGAALRTTSGRIYTGVNVENAAYPTGICAERVAVFKAVSDGECKFEVMAVVTPNGGAPCGRDTIVLIADGSGRLVKETNVNELLPGAFRPDDLKTRP